jgi:Lipocalin-like domain
MFNKDRSNKIIKACGTTLVSLLFFVLVPLSPAQAQVKGKLDVSTYQVPSGYTTAKNTSVARAFIKRYGGGYKFSIITIYASTGSFGNPTTDFSRRWKQLIGDIATEKALPKIEQTTDKNVKIATGVGAVKFQGVDAVAALTTLTVNGRLITISCIFNDEQGAKDYQAFMEGLDLDEALIAQTANSSTASRTSDVVTAPSADLQKIVGIWTEYYFNQGIPAASRNGSASLSYKLNPDGTFGELGGAQIGSKKYPKSGRYQVNGNMLKLIYTDGHAKQYSYKFYAGMDNHEYLLLTLQGSAEEGFFRRQSK